MSVSLHMRLPDQLQRLLQSSTHTIRPAGSAATVAGDPDTAPEAFAPFYLVIIIIQNSTPANFDPWSFICCHCWLSCNFLLFGFLIAALPTAASARRWCCAFGTLQTSCCCCLQHTESGRQHTSTALSVLCTHHPAPSSSRVCMIMIGSTASL